MAKLSIKDVEHIAKLSKLELSGAEKEKFANQLSGVLSFVAELNEVNTENVDITAQVTGLFNSAVDDKIIGCEINYDKIAKNAPEFRDGSFVVPGVFES